MLAPTGTIGFMMDCDTTGIEPDIALVKYKKLVGGGMMKIVNQSVPRRAQASSATAPAQVEDIVQLHRREGDDRGRAAPARTSTCRSSTAPSRRANGKRSIHYMGHIKMMAAVQPFLSGAISKTVNMPTDATPDEIAQRLPRVLAAGPQGGGGLPRRLQAQPAAQHVARTRGEGDGAGARRRPVEAAAGRAASCPTSATRSPTSSRSPATRATSRSGCTRTASRARSSWSWPRRARRSRA